MRPLHLKLRNFIGIRSGLGRDELTVDLSGLRGLIAITGDNGMGKTTVLDNLHPYRVCPFRAAGYSPRQFSYYEETFGEALKELVWEHGGVTYRSEVIIKGANKTKKTEAYLYVQTPDGWVPVTSADGTIADGKTDTYDTCVNAILGTPEMFFTAVFSAQNRKALSDYGAGEIKLLLSDLLGLDPLLALSDGAGEAAKYQQARYDGLNGQLSTLAAAEGDLRLAKTDVARLADDLSRARAHQTEQRQRTSQASMALAEARATAANQDEHVRRRQALEAELSAATLEYQAYHGRIRGDVEREKEAEACADLIRERDLLLAQAGTLDSQACRHREIIAGAPLEDNSADLAPAEAELAALDATLEGLRAKIAEGAELQAQAATLRERMAALKREGGALVAGGDANRSRAALVAQVPCAGMDLNARCPLLKDAHGAKAAADQAEADAARKRAEWTATRDQFAPLDLRIIGLAGTTARAVEAQQRRNELDCRIAGLRKDQAAHAAAAQARLALAEVEEHLNTARAQAAAKAAAIDEARAAAQRRIAVLREEFDRIKAAHTARETRLRAQLAELPAADSAATGLAAAEKAHQYADEAMQAADARVHALQRSLADAEARQTSAQQRMAGADQVRAEASALAEDVAAWRLLSKGLGRDGIVALSIDDAGPTISGIANDLLTACYGPRFSIRFDTQAETKSTGVMKETFDIRVFDAERGDDKSITKTSGGERVWIEQALARAIALFQAQSSGKSYGCLFSDEADGALSPERKRHYMQMKRRVLELGGYEAEFFISHTEELWSQADHVIDMAQFKEAA